MSGVQRFFVSKRVHDYGANLDAKAYAFGGSLIESGGYRIHTFTSSSNVVFTSSGLVEVLCVAGGGGGGWDVGGGGGGGGMISSSINVSATNYIFSVGLGGAFATSSVSGINGGDTSIFNITAIGGGGGGNYFTNSIGKNGGSGGGGGGSAGASGGVGIAGQGFAGGSGASSAHGSGGGGGAGGVGANGIANVVVSGGLPLASSISATSQLYSGGGYGNSDSGVINATGSNASNTVLGVYGFGSNGAGVGSGFSGNQGVIIVRYLA